VKNLRFNSSLLVLFIALAFGSLANAQATRTWVSGVGDDANPCSRTAPCKTFPGAIAKTASAGEIDCLDPGGFGTVTITKPITIDCNGVIGSALVSGTNGIVISTLGATDAVTLRNISLEGLGTGLSGINILAASNVHLENITIHNFTQFGVTVNASASVNLTMRNVTITGDGPGGTSATTGGGISLTTSSGIVAADLNNVRIWNTHPALQGKANSQWVVHDSDLSFNGVAVKAFDTGITMSLINCQLNNNGTAVQSIAGSSILVMGSTLSENTTAFFPNGGLLLSDGQNNVNANGANGTVSGATHKM